MPRAVLFDLDGTLVDSNERHVEAWEAAFAKGGHAVTRAAIRGQIGKGGDLLVPTLVPGADEEAQAALAERHGAIFKERYLAQVPALPGARDLVMRVHATGAKVVLASSASQGDLDHYVALLGIGGLLDASTTIDDVGTSKPAPDIFGVALKKAGGIDPAEALVLGDSPFDMEGAVRAGIRPVAVRTGGFDDDALTRAGAIAIYDSVSDLLARFEPSPLAG